MGYKFITNFKKENIDKIRIALQAVGISDYKFCKEAKNAFGNALPEHYALYFNHNITDKEIELFHRANSMVIMRTLNT